MTPPREQVDVLIVGAGPTGLSLALALHLLGIRPMVVDRQAAGANTSRAAVVHARTLEVLSGLGVADDLLACGLKVPTFRVRDRDRVLLDVDFSGLDTPFPYTLMLPQNETEKMLLRHLHAAGGRVERPVEMLFAKIGTDGADVTLRCENGERTVRARWIVGCDGGHSAVREAAGIGFAGGDYDEAFVLADVSMTWPLPREEVDLFLSRDGLAVVAPLPGERFRIVATVKSPPTFVDAPFLSELLALRGPTQSIRIDDVSWSSNFHLHHRVAQTPWRGRTLLCGDAAHVHSPAGGQGMNTGIQDATSLAAALACTLENDGIGPLQKWAERRHRVAREVVTMTDRMTRMATVGSPLGRAARNAALSTIGAFPSVKRRLAKRLAELDYR